MRHKTWFLVISLALAVALLSACAAHKTIRSVMRQEDDGTKRIVPVKSRLAISLDNPRTPGLVWTGMEWDRSILRADGRRSAGQVKEVADDPYRTVLFFETLKEGVTDLTLAYCYPRNCEETTALTYHVKIKVMKKADIRRLEKSKTNESVLPPE